MKLFSLVFKIQFFYKVIVYVCININTNMTFVTYFYAWLNAIMIEGDIDEAFL